MTADQKLLLENLLDRLDADAESQHPQFRGIVSDRERTALRSLLTEPTAVPRPLGPSPKPPRQPVEVPTPQPVDGPTETREESWPDTTFKLNTTALGYKSSPKPEWTLCLDFGTAKSKAFAATDDEEGPELLPLPIGKADGDLDGYVHEVSSSVWIDDDGLLFLGSEAVKRGLAYGDSTRQRLDSLKPHLELDSSHWEQNLRKNIDPTSTLTYSDAILIYIAYLTDLATTELERHERVNTRYVRRRFTLPWWNEKRRRCAAGFLSKSLILAQLLADTFHGKWHSGIHVDEIKSILRVAAAHSEHLSWIVLTEPEGGVLEALAAASARVQNDRYARDLMVVVDVGAGTTDISLFWVVQQIPPDRQQVRSPKEFASRGRAWPVQPCGRATSQAGDRLDRLLVDELIKRANLGADWALRERVRKNLFREDIRHLKQTLFEIGEITKVLVSGHTVNLTREEFMESGGVRVFEQRICDEIQELLDGVHESWEQAPERCITLVLTGGGCHLPMIRNLANKRWRIGNREVTSQLAAEIPAEVADQFNSEFRQEYPRLAVAMGGALKMVLDERDALKEWYGGTLGGYSGTDGSDWA